MHFPLNCLTYLHMTTHIKVQLNHLSSSVSWTLCTTARTQGKASEYPAELWDHSTKSLYSHPSIHPKLRYSDQIQIFNEHVICFSSRLEATKHKRNVAKHLLGSDNMTAMWMPKAKAWQWSRAETKQETDYVLYYSIYMNGAI